MTQLNSTPSWVESYYYKKTPSTSQIDSHRLLPTIVAQFRTYSLHTAYHRSALHRHVLFVIVASLLMKETRTYFSTYYYTHKACIIKSLLCNVKTANMQHQIQNPLKYLKYRNLVNNAFKPSYRLAPTLAMDVQFFPIIGPEQSCDRCYPEIMVWYGYVRYSSRRCSTYSIFRRRSVLFKIERAAFSSNVFSFAMSYTET